MNANGPLSSVVSDFAREAPLSRYSIQDRVDIGEDGLKGTGYFPADAFVEWSVVRCPSTVDGDC